MSIKRYQAQKREERVRKKHGEGRGTYHMYKLWGSNELDGGGLRGGSVARYIQFGIGMRSSGSSLRLGCSRQSDQTTKFSQGVTFNKVIYCVLFDPICQCSVCQRQGEIYLTPFFQSQTWFFFSSQGLFWFLSKGVGGMGLRIKDINSQPGAKPL